MRLTKEAILVPSYYHSLILSIIINVAAESYIMLTDYTQHIVVTAVLPSGRVVKFLLMAELSSSFSTATTCSL